MHFLKNRITILRLLGIAIILIIILLFETRIAISENKIIITCRDKN